MNANAELHAGIAQPEPRSAPRPDDAGETPAPRSHSELPRPAADFRTAGTADLLVVVVVVAALVGGSSIAGVVIAMLRATQ